VLRRELEESKVKIRELESRVEPSQMMYECMWEGHGIAYGKFVSAREEANRLNTKLSYATNELVACRGKVEALSQSTLIIKMKFRKANEKLQVYKTKARSFYRQLSFASWGRDTGFYMGYLGGFETLKDWVKKPGNFLKIDSIFPKDVAPLKKMISNVSSIGQREMPDCQGIKRIGFRLHLMYDPEARSRAQLPPRLIIPKSQMLIPHNRLLLPLNPGIVRKMTTICIYRPLNFDHFLIVTLIGCTKASTFILNGNSNSYLTFGGFHTIILNQTSSS
jgi:hypothetical protein